MDKRVKKLPLMALSTTMAESFKELDPDSSMGKALEMSCAIQNQLARILAEFEMTLERDVLQPLSRLSEEELPAILKHKKSLQKLVSDWNALKSRLSQAAKNSGSSQGLGGGPSSHSHTTAANKVETLKEEEEELKRRVQQCKDEYLADLYHFATKEDSYANYFIQLLEIQADYHRRSLSSLDTALSELRENHSQADPSPSMTAAPFSRVYGVSLGTHLQELGRAIALPIEACVLMLLSEGMKEEGLFRLAAGASVLKRLKQTMASDPGSLEEFCSDPHAVAGALKSYLRELPEPLMTFDLYDDWMRAASLKEPGARLEALQEVCGRLPRDNHNNLRYLMKFLARLAEEQEVNKMTPSNIAIVLGPNLLWPPEKEGDQAQLDAASVSSIQVVGVVEALIQSADTLFPGDVNFNVSGLFSALAPPDEVGARPASGELPPTTGPVPAATLAPAPAPAPAAVTSRESRTDLDAPPRPASPKVSRSPPETAVPAEDTARRTKRPAPARPTMPPPQVASARSSPPAPPLPPGSGRPDLARVSGVAGDPFCLTSYPVLREDVDVMSVRFQPLGRVLVLVRSATPSLMQLRLNTGMDSGGSLTISLKANETNIANGTLVAACVNMASPFLGFNTSFSCTTAFFQGYALSLNTSSLTANLIIPYPETGTWYLSLQLLCPGSPEGCEQAVVPVETALCLVPCWNDCGPYGQCLLLRRYGYLYAGCSCKAGWRGWSCSDNSTAQTVAQQRVAALLLTLSNLMFLAPITVSVHRAFLVEASVYSYTMFFSTFYHACDQPGEAVLCILSYDTLQYCDFLGSGVSTWVTILCMARLKTVLKYVLFLLGTLVIAMSLQLDRRGIWNMMGPCLFAFVIMASMWVYRCGHRHQCYPTSWQRWVFYLLPGISMASVGITIYTSMMTNDNYYYTHSIWHILLAGSAALLLPPRDRHAEPWACAQKLPCHYQICRNDRDELYAVT